MVKALALLIFVCSSVIAEEKLKPHEEMYIQYVLTHDMNLNDVSPEFWAKGDVGTLGKFDSAIVEKLSESSAKVTQVITTTHTVFDKRTNKLSETEDEHIMDPVILENVVVDRLQNENGVVDFLNATFICTHDSGAKRFRSVYLKPFKSVVNDRLVSRGLHEFTNLSKQSIRGTVTKKENGVIRLTTISGKKVMLNENELFSDHVYFTK